MLKYIKAIAALMLTAGILICCKEDFPVDEDGLLITTRSQCYVSNFELLGVDFQTVRTENADIDTTAQTINVKVFYGTDLKNLFPQFSLVTDAKLDPKITGAMDFSDLANPKKFTVVSGNRKVRKTYTVNIAVQQP
ncbi:DUF5018 domain-containing protein [Dyadobacter pollutisoli]|jgi:hypothetical protein|uniref:DUF5018 domain-containing protein n=1 Tax=Dyadobacter pollutisoli TaxID=2910158 RepID=A0A9E8NEP5_9BACT|nr:DUF5018 domain-containing protein [Dyadobacter pollutisoli]WAC12942.1 DUF5018 domain-containing protein [Dyadobacter pollutisoli]